MNLLKLDINIIIKCCEIVYNIYYDVGPLIDKIKNEITKTI
jgi:hypothetical protein